MSKKDVAPTDHFYPIPNNISLEAAALIEPLAVAWKAVNLSPFKPGDNALLARGGPTGVGIVEALKLQGAWNNIIMSQLMDNHRPLCGSYGATHILGPREGDVAQGVRDITGGVGADVIFDAAGVEKALIGAIPACRVQELQYVGAALYDGKSLLDMISAVDDGNCSLFGSTIGLFGWFNVLNPG
ncbi:hypothetical protein N7451_012326 [Penicillium sp. IBT 35674x]|nr:hypothetical protein N7451_012326 [Penicillium sp. IBT 35674x]